MPARTSDHVSVLERNIRKAISSAKRQGTTGMSFACLKQLTSTDGLSCHPAVYHRDFPRIAQYIAMRMKFELYHA